MASKNTTTSTVTEIDPDIGNGTRATSSTTAVADMTRRMICGGIAGMIAKTATNPLERIKMLSQTGEHGLKSSSAGILGLYRSILKNEGALGLWAGNGVNLFRVFPAKAMVFSSNDMYQEFFRRNFSSATIASSDGKNKVRPIYAFLAGGMAGMSATLLTYPLDFARGRISGKMGQRGSRKEYQGIIRTVLVTVKDEGLFALYKGVTPTLIGALPYEGIKFGTVNFLEKTFPITDEQKVTCKPLRKMIFGGIGGIMAGLITYPNDTVRRLLQLQGSRGTQSHYTGYWDCVRKIYKAQGIGRFYRGVIINIIRMAPNSAVQFGSYEILKNQTAAYLDQ